MTSVNQKEYLKKYLSIGKDPTKKKKKKKEKTIGHRVKIIDDDVDIAATFNEAAKEDLYGTAEDAPQIVGIIDERPLELRVDDYRKSEMWKPVGANSFVPNPVNSPPKTIKEEDETPPRRNKSDEEYSPKQTRNRDPSLVRRKKSDPEVYDKHHPKRSNKRNEYDDPSPPRKHSKHNDTHPRRIMNIDNSPISIKEEIDSSPPRKSNRNNDISPPRKRRNKDYSPPRKYSKYENISPTRISRKDEDNSPPRRTQRNYDSNDVHKRRRDEDNSPPRRGRNSKDNSPLRKNKNDGHIHLANRKTNESKPDRKSRWNRSTSPSSEPINSNITTADVSFSKMKKTLDGKKAGLQNAKDLVEEIKEFKKREDEMFKSLSADISGASATTVVRDRTTGKKRDFKKEIEQAAQKQKEEDAKKAKYNQWGKGLKQVEDQNEKISQDVYEMSKPLARYADDDDLERYLKEQEREGDPMLAYIRKKKKKKAVEEGKTVKPQYEGEFMPNRYGIPPGHRWDGVDRSNGYEKKWFETLNTKKALQEESYRWNSEDM